VLALTAATGAWAALARDRTLQSSLGEWFEKSTGGDERSIGPVLVEGVIAEDAAVSAGTIRLVLNVTAVSDPSGWRHVSGVVQSTVSGELAARRVAGWTAGRRIRVPITLRRPQTLLNFGGPSIRRQILRRPFSLLGSIKSAALVEIAPGHWWDEAAAAVRRRVRKATAQMVAPRGLEAAAIVNAVLIGDRAGLSDDLERRLQLAGTYHVIAISGGNVALLTALCFRMFGLILRSIRILAITTLSSVACYGWVVGGDASVSRAVTAAVLYLGFGAVGVKPLPTCVLRVVAMSLVVADPRIVLETGAWMSFAATLGILVYGRPLIDRFAALCPAGSRVAGVRAVAALISATVAAELLLLPVTASAFGRVSLAGIVLNLVAIPAMAVVQLAGFALVAWQGIDIPASGAAHAAVAASTALLGSCSLVDVYPWLTWRTPPAPIAVSALYYLGLSGFNSLEPGRWRIVSVAVAATSLMVVLVAPDLKRAAPGADRVRLSVVDVGQGEALLLQSPGGRSLLIDAGGTPGPFDIGGRVVTPAVWGLGVRRLNWLLLSHGDRDHVGGAASVLRDLSPDEVWEGIPVPRDPDRAYLRAVSADLGIPWRTVLAGARLEISGVIVEAIHPPPPDWERQKVRNDDSVVLRVQYGLVEFWLTGDAGGEFERSLPASDRGRIRILKVGHHGSRTSTAEAFLEALRPQVALISAGRGNLFGHPSPDVVARLLRAGARVFRTDRDGEIVIETDGAVAKVVTASGRTWTVGLAPSSGL
jgi:competence protein ComEC